jgi:hypothetical protein
MNMNNELNSVEDIDALLDNEFSIDEEDDNQDLNTAAPEDEDNSDDGQDGNDVDTEDGTSDQDNVDEEPSNDDNSGGTQTKITTDEKKEYAFSKIRQENSQLKQEKQKLQAESDFVKELAASYGYTDVDKFKEDVRIAKLNQEAKAKGIDPEIYKQLDDNKREIERLKQESAQKTLNERALNFKNAVEKAVSDYKVDKNDIFNKLEEAGYTVDKILDEPNPGIVLKGILMDKILEVHKQNELKKQETLDNLADVKHESGVSAKAVTLDDLIKSDIEELKANYYN